MRRRFVGPVIIAFALAALVGPLTLIIGTERGQAAFGDNETLGINRLTSATVDVEIGARTIRVEGGNLAPGDRAVGSIEVVNAGTLPLRYAVVTDTSADPLGDWLAWDLWETSTGRACESSPTPVDPLISGLVLGSSGQASAPLIGDATVGFDPGDRVLQPESADVLCVAVTFDLSAPDVLQARRLDQTFTILAEQHTDELAP